MEQILRFFFDAEIAAKALPFLLHGFVTTLILASMTIVAGVTLGLALACLRAYRILAVDMLILTFVDAFRSVPALVILICVYFVLPEYGIRISAFWATVVTLSLVLAAFAEEIFWAGITSIDKGQWEAGRATGLSFTQTLTSIVLRQAIQIVVPPLTNKTINITKNTALGSVVSVSELLNQASSQQALYANPTPLTLAAALYLVIFIPLVILCRHLESRYAVSR
jgi:His/Glu/Gln/Arg/opine family amino acid ABC transporter permease subunit